MTLIAERIHIDGREEDAIGAADHKVHPAADLVGKAQARSKVVFVRVNQAPGHSELASDKSERRSILEDQIAVGIRDIGQGRGIFVAHA